MLYTLLVILLTKYFYVSRISWRFFFKCFQLTDSPCPPASASAHALFREFSYIAPGFFAEHNDNHNTTTTNNCNNHVNLNKEVLNGTNITCLSSPKEKFNYSSRHDDGMCIGRNLATSRLFSITLLSIYVMVWLICIFIHVSLMFTDLS